MKHHKAVPVIVAGLALVAGLTITSAVPADAAIRLSAVDRSTVEQSDVETTHALADAVRAAALTIMCYCHDF